MMPQILSIRARAQQIKAREAHDKFGHSWMSSFMRGEYLCLICGIKAYCPRCYGPLPAGARIHSCYTHREER